MRQDFDETIDDRLTELALKIAAELERRAAHDGLSRVNEQAHLQPCCADVAVRSLRRGFRRP